MELWQIYFLSVCVGIAAVAALVFIVVGLTCYKRYPICKDYKKYAFFIPARNEERVIGNLIKSIRAMDYPQDKIDIFVLANNCNKGDRTAEIARELGEKVFELQDKNIKNVGGVLEKFFEYVKEEIGYKTYDGYIRLDADNIVDGSFLKKMNDAFNLHPTVITAYRANKNFNAGVRASLTCTLMSASMIGFKLFSTYNINPIITGPGVLLSSGIITEMDGWHCKTLSEDVELSAVLIKMKKRAYFVYDAVFYDEQPVTIKMIWRQRLRWTAGTNQVFNRNWFSIIGRIFSKVGVSALFMAIGLFPMGLTTVVFTFAFSVYGFVMFLLKDSFNYIFMFILLPIIINVIMGWVIAILVFISEHKRIKVNFFKKLIYIFVFPVSLAMQNLADFARLFIKIKWKPIVHGEGRKL
jgi:cellulose synthase/poly-beta-1,6-N-acetylglucosamine synthase-like glycosyltransferase